MIFNFKTWCIYIYIYNIYLHTYIYGSVNTDTHDWRRATETLALGCPGTTIRFKDLSDTVDCNDFMIHDPCVYPSQLVILWGSYLLYIALIETCLLQLTEFTLPCTEDVSSCGDTCGKVEVYNSVQL